MALRGPGAGAEAVSLSSLSLRAERSINGGLLGRRYYTLWENGSIDDVMHEA